MKVINTSSGQGLAISRSAGTERYLREIGTKIKLTKAEEKEIFQKIRQGDLKAKEFIAKQNLPFVVSCAKEYQTPKIDVQDLIAFGNEGLLHAIDKFDAEKDVKFISFAVWHIKCYIITGARQMTNTIELPLNQSEQLRKLAKFKEQTEDKFQGTVGLEFLIDEYIKENPEVTFTNIKSIRDAIAARGNILSVDSPLDNSGDDNPSSLSDLSDLNNSLGTEEVISSSESKKEINLLLNKLTPQQQTIVGHFYGLNGLSELSIDLIAQKLNITTERVRHINKKALLLLRQEYERNLQS